MSMILAALSLGLSCIANAQTAASPPPAATGVATDISPGLWEIVMNTNVPDQPGWKPEPFSLHQCLTAFDAANPEKLISSFATPGATGCTFTENTNSGGVVKFNNTCSGSYDLKTSGSIRFTPSSMDGVMHSTAMIGGQKTTFESQITAHRVGACN